MRQLPFGTSVPSPRSLSLLAGLLHAGIGLAFDASTGNLGGGTALASLAIPGMPFFFLPVGIIGGLLWARLCRRLPRRLGGCGDGPES